MIDSLSRENKIIASRNQTKTLLGIETFVASGKR